MSQRVRVGSDVMCSSIRILAFLILNCVSILVCVVTITGHRTFFPPQVNLQKLPQKLFNLTAKNKEIIR